MFFQVGWFLLVLTSQSNYYLLILPLVLVFLAFELHWYRLSIAQYAARVLLACIGHTFDSLIHHYQLVHFESIEQWSFAQWSVAPFWLWLLWLWFAITLSACYRWLNDKLLLAIILGACFGPFAYWGASQLGSLIILSPWLFTSLSILFWGSLFALLFSSNPFGRLLLNQSTRKR